MNPEAMRRALDAQAVAQCEETRSCDTGIKLPGETWGVADMNRRAFLKTLGGLAVAGAVMNVPFKALGIDDPDKVRVAAHHLIPLDKELPAGWIQALFEQHKKEIWAGAELEKIGMPVGGIATGQLYLTGDGTLGCWEIFNEHKFVGMGQLNYNYHEIDTPVDQGFAMIARDGKKKVTRRLSKLDFPDVRFNGTYPIGRVLYRDENFPIEAELEAFSPFIPLEAENSGLPATILNVTLRHRGKGKLDVALAGWLANAVLKNNAANILGVERHTRVRTIDGATVAMHSVAPQPAPERTPDEREPIVIEDFEGETFENWQAEGEAFSEGPIAGTLDNQLPVTGFKGDRLVNSFAGGGDRTTGRLLSPPFEIQRKYINLLVGGGSHENQTEARLLVGGVAVRTARGQNAEHLLWKNWAVEEFAGRQARIEIIDQHEGHWGHINVDHIVQSDRPESGISLNQLDGVADYGTMALTLAGEAQSAQAAGSSLEGLQNLGELASGDQVYPVTQSRSSALLTPWIELGEGDEKTYTFILSWHFPNHKDGRNYANRFEDAQAVASYVLDNYEHLAGRTRAWRDCYYTSTMPYWLLDRLHSTLSYLATGTTEWWGNGRFWAWEGVVCCHGTCTHVWNYAHGHARLFPEIGRNIRERQDFHDVADGGGFHPDSGLVGFRSDDNYAADGQCGTILKAYREHLMSADDDFLKRNWPRIKKAMEYSIERDGEADAVNGILKASQHNTYDINFFGANTMVGSLYLGALRAAEAMARDMGDDEFAERVKGIYSQGSAWTDKNLFNGEYYTQEVDLQEHPQHQYGPGCLSDQMFGQGWAHQVGLGYLYSRENVRKALESIWRYNWAPNLGPYKRAHPPGRVFAESGEAGLLNCTWPQSRFLDQGVLYKNEVWTGIEYQVAGHMIWEGMVTEGLSICRAIHDRYHPFKRNPYNEVECSDHYARALASWGVYLALGGFEYHGPKGHIGFAPRINAEDFQCAFTAAEGWGSFRQKRQEDRQGARIDLKSGQLRLRSLSLDVPSNLQKDKVTAMLGDSTVNAEAHYEGSRLTLVFEPDIVVTPETPLVVETGKRGWFG